MPQQDIFPATIVVATPDSTPALRELRSSPPTKAEGVFSLNTARIIITNTRVLIAKDGPQGPVPVFSAEIDPTSHYKSPDKSKDSFIQTTDGRKIAFRRDSACGCGSRLKSWRPFGHLTSNQDPTS